LLLVSCSLAQAGWGDIRQLTSAPDNCNLPTIGHGLAAQGQYVHIAYAAKVAGVWKVLGLRSTDRGANWDEPVVLEDALEAFTFSITADGVGNVHLINRRPQGRLFYRRSTDNGATWLAAEELGAAETPILLTDRDRHVYIVDPQVTTLYIRRSTDGGESWLSPAPITTQSGFGGLRASATPGGRVRVAWSYGVSGESHIYYVNSTDRGANWGSVERVSTTPRVASYGLWSGDGGNVLLAFTRSQGPQNFRFSTDDGGSWSAETALPVLLGDGTADGYGGVHCLGIAENERVMYLRTASRGATWIDALNISGTEAGTKSKSSIAIDELANLFAVWNSRQTGTVQVYVRKGEGAGGTGGAEGRVPPAASVFPNPARAALFLSGAGSARLYDVLGREAALLRSGANDVSMLPRAVYVAWARSGTRPVGRVVLAG